MRQDETQVAPVEVDATPIKRGVGRPRKVKPPAKQFKEPRKPYGMKDSDAMEKGGSAENQNKKYRGFSGQCVRLKIIANGGESRFPSFLSIKLGDLPAVHIRANREVIVPVEALGVLNDTTVEIPKPGTIGPGEEREGEALVRIPLQVFGPASWEEYEAFLGKERAKPLDPVKN